MTTEQRDFFSDDHADLLAGGWPNSEARFSMLSGLYLDLKKVALKKDRAFVTRPYSETKAALILLLVEPCLEATSTRRKIAFLLQDDVALKMLDDLDLQRILLSSLVCLKRASGDLNHLHTAKFNRVAAEYVGSWYYLSLPCVEPEDVVAKSLFLLCENEHPVATFDDGPDGLSPVQLLLSSFMHLKEA